MSRTAPSDLVAGADGRRRCWWGTSTPDYLDYHDTEWGVPVHGDTAVFERITLEAFQSGLSWLTILRKRPAFRVAFAGFDIAAVAAFTPRDEDRLLADAGIVRNRAKISATVANARAAAALIDADGEGALDRLVWSFAPDPGGRGAAPRSRTDLPTATVESTALARALKAAGFGFVGPTTAYAAMQAMGLVDDHLVGCHARGAAPRPADDPGRAAGRHGPSGGPDAGRERGARATRGRSRG